MMLTLRLGYDTTRHKRNHCCIQRYGS